MQEQLEGGNIKGGVLKAHLDWFRQHHAALGVKALFDHVSSDTRTVLAATVLPSQWYAFRVLIEADRAIHAVHGGDEKTMIMDLGRHSARQNLSTSYRAFASLQLQEFLSDLREAAPAVRGLRPRRLRDAGADGRPLVRPREPLLREDVLLERPRLSRAGGRAAGRLVAAGHRIGVPLRRRPGVPLRDPVEGRRAYGLRRSSLSISSSNA
jgi:hypothetical protein